jgi:O-acetyl-ADP-ribose deacetylase (regulator of RNase III)
MSNLDNFCKDGDTKHLNDISEVEATLLIHYSFKALSENKGDTDRARNVLVHYGEIETVNEDYSHLSKKGKKDTYIDSNLSFDVYTGPKLDNSVLELERVGVTTIPVLLPSELHKVRAEFVKTLQQFPEYSRGSTPDLNSTDEPLVYVLGGFAALGNPASFHNPLVRKLRMAAYKSVSKNLFKPLISDHLYKKDRKEMKIEVLFDRMMYRLESMKPSAESWHRDVMPSAFIEDDDEVYGGWINLDSVDQYFSCIPGSHLGIHMKSLREGFATVDAEMISTVSNYKQKIRVPPGHCVIFPQYILHEVVANAAKYDMFRLFTGWRKTTSSKSLRPEIIKDMKEQAVMKIPGGMIPPMYAANHGSFFLRKEFKPIPNKPEEVNLITWSDKSMKSETLVEKGSPSYKVVLRHMHSLKHYGFPLYPPYEEDEMVIYIPSSVNISGYTVVNGDLLNATEQYIAHQCNCIGNRAYGLSAAIFKKFPASNVYKGRTEPDTPGTIRVIGRVINMFAQYSVKGPIRKETKDNREKWFAMCLNEISSIDNIQSIALPWNIGSGLAGGNWDSYSRMLEAFATSNPSIKVVLYIL